MPAPDVATHVKAALASSKVDDEVSEYVSDMMGGMLDDADDGASRDELVEELVDAAGGDAARVYRRERGEGAVRERGESPQGRRERRRRRRRRGGGGGGGGGGGDGADEKKDYCLDLQGIILAFAGKVLLRPTSLRLEIGRRYGVVGQNGAGKTTLLTRLAAGDINGFPPRLRCVFVQHEVLVSLAAPVKDFLKSQAIELGADANDVAPCLRAVGFTDELARKTVTELSGGMADATRDRASDVTESRPPPPGRADEPPRRRRRRLARRATSERAGDTPPCSWVSHDYDFLADRRHRTSCTSRTRP